jgi:hypothetical protein
MDVAEMIKQAEADLDRAEADLATARDQLLVAQEREQHARMRAREMQAIRDWLQAQHVADARSATTSSAAEAGATRFGKPIPEISQADLCLRVLRSLGRATTKEIRDRLAFEGHQLDTDQIRSSLRYLANKKPPLIGTNPGSGVWWLLEPSSKTRNPDAVSTASAMNGAVRRP